MSKKKKTANFLSTGNSSTYSDGILVIYDKVLKTPDSYIAINNISRTGSSFWRSHAGRFFPGLLLLAAGSYVAGSIITHYENKDETIAILAMLAFVILGLFLIISSFKKTHGLHIELNSGARVTFLAPDEESAANAALSIAEVMRNPNNASEPITINFSSSQTTMIDSSTSVNNQNYGVNYGSVGNSANYNYPGGYGGAASQPTYGQNPTQAPNQNQYPYYR